MGKVKIDRAKDLKKDDLGKKVIVIRDDLNKSIEKGKFQIGVDSKIQSKQLYIQAAGSDGTDSAIGIHLKWMFRDDLGNNHLPKGNYSKAKHGYNKENDFVEVYRIPYHEKNRVASVLSFTNTPQAISNELYSWWYETLNEEVKKVYLLKFLDRQIYDNTLVTINSQTNAFDFFQAYNSNGGIIEINLKTEECFAITLSGIEGTSADGIKIETFSVEHHKGAEEVISNRKSVHQNNVQLFGENIKRIRLKIGTKYLAKLEFEFYSDFIKRNQFPTDFFNHLGSFALTLKDLEAYSRLENIDQFSIDGHWKQNNGNSRVKVASYRKKWGGLSNELKGTKYGVEHYIDLSEDIDNPTAKDIFFEDNQVLSDISDDKKSKGLVSYLNLLNIISTNFHIARMLGQAHIDSKQESNSDKYIYVMEYFIPKLGSSENTEQHLYMTLPTSRLDNRPPMEVETLPIQYGLDYANNSKVCDVNGYTPDGENRFIRLYNKLLVDYSESNSFFNPAVEFSLADMTNTVFVGIEYKKGANPNDLSDPGEADWREPEISNQIINGHNEPQPLLFFEKGEKPSLIHKETEEGVHIYATYPTNIFSRSGEVSNSVATDFTKFTIPNRLLPPSNLKVQLIQEEKPLLLTSQEEQDALNSLADNELLLRVIFDVNHEHDINFQHDNLFTEEIEFLFKDIKQRVVKGKAETTSNSPKISTTKYVMNQIGIPDEIPNITVGKGDNFVGGKLNVNGSQFDVEQVQEGLNPEIIVKPNIVSELINDGNGNISSVDTVYYPTSNPESLFMLEENLENPDSWDDNYFNFKLNIQFPNSIIKSESFVDELGNTTTRKLRGFWANAKISNDTTAGLYQVTFDSFQLPYHPQSSVLVGSLKKVDFFGGYVRFHESNDTSKERKNLKVLMIDRTQSNLILTVQDETYDSLTSIGFDVPLNTSAEINYYPSYKVYLKTDLSAGFTNSAVIPSLEFEKQTIFTALTKAKNPNDLSTFFRSRTSGPKIISAEKVISALRPIKPQGPRFPTFPDLYSKSTYTFECEFEHMPYAIVVYRTSINSLLNALYKVEDIKRINKGLKHTYEDSKFYDRWDNMINSVGKPSFISNPLIGKFKFPLPNKLGSFGSKNNLDSVQIQKAIENASLPILKEPLLLEKVIKDVMSHDHPAIILNASNSNNLKIRFTDYSLDGEKVDSYFYFVKEMSSKYELGEASEILGPIMMINNRALEMPVIRKITSQENNDILDKEPLVRIEILSYQEINRVRKIKLFRAQDELDALSIRTMTLVKEIDLDENSSSRNSIQIEDDFKDLNEIPFGDQLFYRIVAYRHLKYIKDNTLSNNTQQAIDEFIPSKPSKILSTIVIDSTNPETPAISIVKKVLDNNEENIVVLKLTWNKTTYKGKYTLSKMNSRGNWNIVQVIESNNESDLYYQITEPLPKLNEDGKTIYHRFKVDVLGTSGLSNKTEVPIVI